MAKQSVHRTLMCGLVGTSWRGRGASRSVTGAPWEEVAAGDFVFVPRGTEYEFAGEMHYLVMNGPAFRAGSDEVLGNAL
jgi:hypothetical protein